MIMFRNISFILAITLVAPTFAQTSTRRTAPARRTLNFFVTSQAVTLRKVALRKDCFLTKAPSKPSSPKWAVACIADAPAVALADGPLPIGDAVALGMLVAAGVGYGVYLYKNPQPFPAFDFSSWAHSAVLHGSATWRGIAAQILHHETAEQPAPPPALVDAEKPIDAGAPAGDAAKAASDAAKRLAIRKAGLIIKVENFDIPAADINDHVQNIRGAKTLEELAEIAKRLNPEAAVRKALGELTSDPDAISKIVGELEAQNPDGAIPADTADYLEDLVRTGHSLPGILDALDVELEPAAAAELEEGILQLDKSWKNAYAGSFRRSFKFGNPGPR